MKMPDSVGKSNWKHKLSIANLEQLLLPDNLEGKSVFQPETSLVHPYLIIQHGVTKLPQTWMNCQFDKWFQLFKQLPLPLTQRITKSLLSWTSDSSLSSSGDTRSYSCFLSRWSFCYIILSNCHEICWICHITIAARITHTELEVERS